MGSLPDRSSQRVIGLDVGGANLKYADSTGRTHCVEFPLWQKPSSLRQQLASDLKQFAEEATTGIAAVMTGELADCFLDREKGVRHIVAHLDAATESLGLPRPAYYGVDGEFHAASWAMDHPDAIAAANWHALATYVAREIAADGCLVDIGSTTTDIIPLAGGEVATKSQTDFDRLSASELVYLGGGRTPVCSIVDALTLEERPVPVMREVFATMDDVRILLGHANEAPDDCQTADGKPRDRFHAANRMARMIGLDHRSISIATATDFAKQVHLAAQSILDKAIGEVANGAALILSGHASDLINASLTSPDVIDLRKRLGLEVSRVAPAFASAMLLSHSITACDAS